MKPKNALVKTALAIIAFTFIVMGLLAQSNNDRQTVKIQTNLDCQACKQKIEKYMAFEKGVVSVEADVATKVVTIGYKTKKTTEDKLVAAIEKLGYTAKVIEEKQPE